MFKKIALTLMLLAGSMMLTACGSDSRRMLLNSSTVLLRKRCG